MSPSPPADRELMTTPSPIRPDELSEPEAARRPGAVRVGLGLTYLATATIPWTGITFGTLSVGEAILFVAAFALVLADAARVRLSLPPWTWAMVLTVLVVGLVDEFFPTSSDYIVHRDQLVGNSTVVHGLIPYSDVSVMFHLVVRLIILPFVFVLVRSYGRQAFVRSAMALVAGCAINAAIAFSDSRGLTAIGQSVVGVAVSADHRASGLTDNPNVVALDCVIALPLVLWAARAANSRARRYLALGALLAIALGLYSTRSRSGAGAAAVAAVVSVFSLPQYRRFIPATALGLGIVGGALFVADPSLGAELLRGLRLSGGDSSGSDQARSIVNDQAVRDFLHAPVRGIGFQVAAQAHVVYLQALAVGGVILLAGYLVYTIGSMVRCLRLTKVEPLALPLLISVLGVAVVNGAQNALTPAIVYVTGGLIAALPRSDAPPERARGD